MTQRPIRRTFGGEHNLGCLDGWTTPGDVDEAMTQPTPPAERIIPIRLTPGDRDLILSRTFVGGELERRIRFARAEGSAGSTTT